MKEPGLPRKLNIIEYKNAEIVRSRYPFRYESYKVPELKKLRKRYRLDEVVAGKKREFDEIVALRNWVRSRWDHGWSFKKIEPAPASTDALKVLSLAEEGVEFHCVYYACLFVQCALALGFQARVIDIGKDISGIPLSKLHLETNIGHTVPEIWSNEFQKWIIMDPDMNVHYEEKGIPLNACEIRRAWLEKRWKKVRMVQGTPPPAYITKPEKYTKEWRKEFKVFTRYNVMDYYHHIAVEMRNNWFSSGGKTRSLILADSDSPPLLFQHPDLVLHEVGWTQNVNEMYWTLNQVHIRLNWGGATLMQSPVLDVRLETVTPNFSAYLVKIDRGAWTRRTENFRWKLKKGQNTIQAKTLNKLEREGMTSSLTVLYR